MSLAMLNLPQRLFFFLQAESNKDPFDVKGKVKLNIDLNWFSPSTMKEGPPLSYSGQKKAKNIFIK